MMDMRSVCFGGVSVAVLLGVVGKAHIPNARTGKEAL